MSTDAEVIHLTDSERPWIPEDTWGSRIAQVRQRYGWNVKEAALTCGIAPQTWRSWENDGRAPRGQEDVARKIAAVTGCDLDWLLRGWTSRSR